MRCTHAQSTPGHTYHYALFVAAKSGAGSITKHHVKNTLQIDAAGETTAPWRYERTEVSNVEHEHRLLVRVVIAKVLKPGNAAERALKFVPVNVIDGVDKAQAESFTCRTLVRDALQELEKQGVVSNETRGWDAVELRALQYVDNKRAQKRWDSAWTGCPGVPTMDLLVGKEIFE